MSATTRMINKVLLRRDQIMKSKEPGGDQTLILEQADDAPKLARKLREALEVIDAFKCCQNHDIDCGICDECHIDRALLELEDE